MASVFGRAGETIVIGPPARTEQALIERCRLARRDERSAVLEGLHALKHALRFDARIDAAYTADAAALAALAAELAPDIVDRLPGLVQELPGGLFDALTPRSPETGVLALAARPLIDRDGLLSNARRAPLIWLEEPAHLGNIGAVVRVAAAAGAGGVVTSGHHDPWDPAALRGSAGLHFALPVVRLSGLPAIEGPLIAIDPSGQPLQPDALPANAVLAFGSERRGVSPDLLKRADQCLSLPMRPSVSSLNLATAVAAVLYAWRLGSKAGRENDQGFTVPPA